jgi:hypothetical protein
MFKKYIVSFSLVVLVLVSLLAPTQSSAESRADQLKSEIAELQAKLTKLETELKSLTATSATCAPFTQNLTLDTRNDEVKRLQEFLYKKGFFKISPTGYFGALTGVAVRNYQYSVGISESDYFGPVTRAYVNGQLCGSVATTKTQTTNTADFKLREIWVTGFSAKVGDTLTINASPKELPAGYQVYFEAWDEKDASKVAEISKVECPSSPTCTLITTWKPAESLLEKGDKQFVIRAVLKKGNIVVNTVRTGKVYMIGKPAYSSEKNSSFVNTGEVSKVPAFQPQSAVVGSQTPPVSFVLTADKATYKEGEQIKMVLVAKNTSKEPVILKFNSGCARVVYTVGEFNSEKSGTACSSDLGQTVTVKPQSEYSWLVTHNSSTYKLTPGNYTFTASVRSINKSDYAGVEWYAALPVQVTSALSGSVIQALVDILTR